MIYNEEKVKEKNIGRGQEGFLEVIGQPADTAFEKYYDRAIGQD